MRRRSLLRVGALAAAGSAGCLDRDRSTDRPTPFDDPPDRIYRPTAAGEAHLVDVVDADPFRVALLYSAPVPFWEVVGRTTYRRGVEPDDSVHLMATAWEPGTGLLFPEVGLTVEVRRDGDLVAEEAVYAMLSQRLGFHYGDNIALPDDGRYDVRVRVGGLQLRRTGAFAGRFGAPAGATVPFDFSRAERDELAARRSDDPGSDRPLAPVDLDGVPDARAPRDLPGRRLGTATTDGAVLEAHVVAGDDASRFVDGAGAARFVDGDGTPTPADGDAIPASAGGDRYLVVVARTPHNGLLLPSMGLRATVRRDGEPVFDEVLARTVDPSVGYHYGAPVPALEAGDELRFETLTPPQVARHEGYETAFVEMPPASLTVSG